MYLKSIELQGFKSFADPMTFTFSQGISAIVGPNGSGKSNIVDAIRWVLGEQSAKSLRGGKMEDVIFSGSNERKAVGLARVTIILDNAERRLMAEGDEVEVQRTLHRSGESDYRINRKNCRLKDIHELFMDTGIGRDGFSVIGQGKIDEILVQHAEERRSLIEEAAGISKYKYRKREAERKLQSTREDMDRLEDILFELKDRLVPLAEQADKVRQYRRIKDDEDALQLAVWARTHQRIASQQDSVRLQLQELQDAEATLSAQVRQAEADRMGLMAEKDRVFDAMTAAQEVFIQTGRQLEALDGRLGVVAEKRNHVAMQQTTADEKWAQLSSEVKDQATAIDEAMVACAKDKEVLRLMKKELEDQQQSLTRITQAWSEKRNALTQTKEHQFSLLSKRAALHNEETKWQQALSGHQFRQQKNSERMANLSRQADALGKKIKALQKEHAEEADQQKRRSEQLQALQADAVKKQSALDDNNRLRVSQTSEIQKLQSRWETLQELEATGEGYYSGVQAVLQGHQRGELGGIHGSVAQLLDIPDGYLIALENALGATAQNIVVTSDQDAASAIQWLKKGQRGRVTFMPLNTVKGERSRQQPTGAGIIGTAADLVRYDSAYQGIMNHLLGRIWIVEDLEKARHIAKENHFKFRLVTLDGDILSPGGTMSGGHNKKQTPVLRRKKEMKKIAEKVTGLQDALAVTTDELTALSIQKQQIQIQIDEITEIQQNTRLRQSEKETLITQMAAQKEDIAKEMRLEEQDGDALGNDLEQADLELAKLSIQLAEVNAETEALEDNLCTLQADVDALEEERNSVAAVVQEKHIVVVQKEEKATYQQQQVERLQRDHEATRREQEDIRERQAGLVDLSAELNAEYSQLKAEIKAGHDRYRQEEKAVAEWQAQLRAHEQQVNTDEMALKTQRENLQLVQTNLHKQENLTEKIRMQSEQLAELLQTQMQLSPEEALEKADFDIDTTRSTERLKDMRLARAQLGELNFTAVEEHQVVQERTTFLSTQLHDLNAAKEKLEMVISEMEQTMSERFKATYEKVNAHFGEIFIKMFEGGQAKLALSMPGNYLETGVEIIAQPPGKKASVLTLLSGGERAMTAIALLFALQEVRPSPFVILDEIEAALDEANIERFAGFLKKYATGTQFIIISHRRGTMEAASVLYGVTMDRNGVSKQVSVRLSSYGEDDTHGIL